ncbi:TetR/AcrR family transcriptional regulator [Zavarzinia compransoris]|uniref:HTH tetR-type domain-containing protein n=1 Tax=Zavarzinia compransoris TaxID=1264899 RepID=A0A317DSQ6_9PROT|nr:TetR/AcrR family transcriptional regulator [Zavarzinia compransoris]PWR17717.1 hypothetical protein DKG75_21450 [Zavarzinia compransoris]TDP49240.1 TetR family transcriptional regulator [Zavarzinia compransoris]
MTRMTEGDEGAGRRRLSADERRSQILAAARQLFIQEGVDNTSMRRIAQLAGVTPTLIYHHFADKAALMLSVCQEFFFGLMQASEEARRPRPEDADPLAPLGRLMAAYVRFGLENPDVYRLVFMTRIATLKRDGIIAGHRPRPDHQPHPEDKGFGIQSFGILEGEIRRLTEAGALRPNDPAALAEMVWATGHGLVSLLITHGDFKWTPFDDLQRLAIDSLLRGIRR